jgi:DNA-binding Lrp family transcriptional regulator
MLNKTDLRLISELEEDGRASYTQLSQTIGISASTVAKKIDNLVDDGIISIHAVLNPYRLGVTAHAIIAVKTYVGKLDIVCNYLKNIPNVDLIVAIFGRYNLIISAQFMNWDDLHEFISSKLVAVNGISEMQILFTKDDKKRRFEAFSKRQSANTVLNIDKIDREIIEALHFDGRCGLSSIASQLGLSVSYVSKRLSRLLKEQAIRICAAVDQNKIGFHASAFILVHADHDHIENICQKFLDFTEIKTIITLVNGYEILISAVTKDSESLYDLVNNEIAAIPGVIDTETWLRGKIFKRYSGPIN